MALVPRHGAIEQVSPRHGGRSLSGPQRDRSHRGSHHDARDPELAQPTRNAESAWACFVAELHAWIPSVRLTKSRQELFDSMEIVADGSIEPHFPASPALSYRDGN